MTAQRAIELLQIECDCLPCSHCDMKCSRCDFNIDKEGELELMDAYNYAIELLKNRGRK